MRFSNNQSCKRRCARCLPRNRLEIGVPTFVSYRAGRCLTRLEVRLESSNVAVYRVQSTELCAVFATISAKTRQNLAVGGLCGLSCFRPSFRIVLADVCGPECRHTSLCAVFAKIAFSPARNTKSNTTNRPLSNEMLYDVFLTNICSRLRGTLL